MLLVGLTGGIGSGKSTVAEALVARGAVLVDGDRIAREIVAPGGPAYQPVVDRFGPAVVAADGAIDRPALAAVVFADSTALAALNSLTHPVIARVMIDEVNAHRDEDRVVILDIPLLTADAVEFYGLQAVVVVDTPEDVAVGRLVAHRGFAEADARARVAAQISRQERRSFADVVIDNSSDPDDLNAEVDRVWDWLDHRRQAVSGNPAPP